MARLIDRYTCAECDKAVDVHEDKAEPEAGTPGGHATGCVKAKSSAPRTEGKAASRPAATLRKPEPPPSEPVPQPEPPPPASEPTHAEPGKEPEAAPRFNPPRFGGRKP